MSDESDTSLENACYWHARAESAEADNAILHEKIAHLNYELGVVD